MRRGIIMLHQNFMFKLTEQTNKSAFSMHLSGYLIRQEHRLLNKLYIEYLLYVLAVKNESIHTQLRRLSTLRVYLHYFLSFSIIFIVF